MTVIFQQIYFLLIFPKITIEQCFSILCNHLIDISNEVYFVLNFQILP